jgi:hypothetical protein
LERAILLGRIHAARRAALNRFNAPFCEYRAAGLSPIARNPVPWR